MVDPQQKLQKNHGAMRNHWTGSGGNQFFNPPLGQKLFETINEQHKAKMEMVYYRLPQAIRFLQQTWYLSQRCSQTPSHVVGFPRFGFGTHGSYRDTVVIYNINIHISIYIY